MFTQQQLGGYAAIVQGCLWIIFIVFIAFINPSLGIASPIHLANPLVLLPALGRTPMLMLFPGLDIVVGLSLFVVVVSLGARLEPDTWMRYITPLGVGAAVLFVVLATSRLHTLPELAARFTQNQTGASAQFLLVDSLHSGFTAATRLLLGLWILGSSLTLRRDHLKRLVYVGIAAAIVNIVGVFFELIAGLNVVLIPLWFFTLARWLLKPDSKAAQN